MDTPGTNLCIKPELASLTRPLNIKELKDLNFGEVRALHPDEILATFSFRRDELPRFVGELTKQWEMACQTICLNVFEAFGAEALAAMGISAPKEIRRNIVKATFSATVTVRLIRTCDFANSGGLLRRRLRVAGR